MFFVKQLVSREKELLNTAFTRFVNRLEDVCHVSHHFLLEILNGIAFVHHWDAYPFILLNLLFSTQAAYAAPIIMMAQNRQSQRDRAQADSDYKTNVAAKEEIEELMTRLDTIEIEKLDKIITMLEKMEKSEK